MERDIRAPRSRRERAVLLLFPQTSLKLADSCVSQLIRSLLAMPGVAPTLIFTLVCVLAQSAFAAPTKGVDLSCRSKLTIDTDLVAQNAIAATNQRCVSVGVDALSNAQCSIV